MKRLWYAVIFLCVTAVLCVGEQRYVESFYDDMNACITAAESAVKNKNREEYKKATAEIEKLWRDKNDLLYATGEHSALDGIAVLVRSMPYDENEEIKELHSLRAQLFSYYQNEKISLSNVF